MSLNAATIEVLLSKGLTASDMLDVARALEADKPRSKGAERQARYRQNKAAGVTSDVTGDVTSPPKDDKSNPPHSEPNGSGGDAADPVKELFDVGVSILTASGQTEKQARSLIGKWRKDRADGEVLTALIDCRARAITNPVEWITKRFGSSDYVSASGYVYRGSIEDVIREATRRGDTQTMWLAKSQQRTAAHA